MNTLFNINMFINNGLNCNFMPFGNCSFNNFSFFNMPFLNFTNFWNNGSYNNYNYNNISIFNNFSMSGLNNCWNNFSFGDTFVRTTAAKKPSGNNSNGTKVLNKALSYVDKVNSDAEGVRLFSPAGSLPSRGWCSDFATYCAAKALGNKYPKSMITGSPAGLIEAAGRESCYVKGWSSSAKPGDIIIVPGKGVSGLHVAIIKSIDGNGKITAVSGNSKDKVKLSYYSTSSVKGFVSMDKLA